MEHIESSRIYRFPAESNLIGSLSRDLTKFRKILKKVGSKDLQQLRISIDLIQMLKLRSL